MGPKKANLIGFIRGAFELGKWKVQHKRLGKERLQQEQKKSQTVQELGAEAWRLRIRDSGYGVEFDRLIALETKRDEARQDLETLGAEIEQQELERRQLDERFNGVLAEVEGELRAGTARLNDAVNRRKAAEKTRKSLLSQQESTRRQLQATRSALEKSPGAAEGGSDPIAMEGSRRELEQALSDLSQQIDVNDEHLGQCNDGESRCRAVVEQQKEALADQRARRLEALQPKEAALKTLRTQRTDLEQRRSALDEEQVGYLAEFGARINALRPPAEGLSDHYGRIDDLDGEIRRIDSDRIRLEHKIAAAGPGAKRTFYGAAALFLLGVLGVVSATLYVHLPNVVPRSNGELAVRVVDQTQSAILGASTVLFFEGGPVAQYSDIHGFSTLKLDDARGRRGRLVVEATGFRIHEQSVPLSSGELVEVRLLPPDPVTANVLVRTVKSGSQEPVIGAKVLVMANGDTFSEVGDSNGITKFTLAFAGSKVDAEMNVRSKGFAIEHQRVTLLPDQVQDVSLDRQADQLVVRAFDVDKAVSRNFRAAEDQILEPGTRAVGPLRQGTETAFSFAGHANTPILFGIERTAGDLGYAVQFHDPKDFLLQELGTYYGGLYYIPFTPGADGKYSLTLKGVREGGTYSVTMSYLSGPPARRNNIAPLTLERSQKGMLAVGAFDDFVFPGSVNTPLLLKIQRATGELGYSIEIFDEKQTSLVHHGKYWGGLKEIPFTPPADGKYRIQVQGNNNYGSYNLAVQLVAGTAEDRNRVTAVDLDQDYGGYLAAGASDSYRFSGHHNTPVLITLQRTRGELGYSLEIYDSQNRRLSRHGRFWGGVNVVPFTPQLDDEYRLKLVADRNFGGYGLSMKLVSGPAAERNQVSALLPGGSLEGSLAIGAFDDYLISGKGGQKLMLTTQHLSNSLGYWVRIFNVADEKLAEHGRFYSGTNPMEFVPPENGDYRVRISADRGFGPYVVTLNED